MNQSEPTPEPGLRLSDNRTRMASEVHRAMAHFGLNESQIRQDYWLVRSLCEIVDIAGPRTVLRHPYTDSPVGSLVFGGGTAVTAAWDVAERYSEDIDLMLQLHAGAKRRHVRATLKSVAVALTLRIGGRLHVRSADNRHMFFSIMTRDNTGVRVDITTKDLTDPVLMIPHKTPVSLIGRLGGPDLADEFPELGRSRTHPSATSIPTISPISTAMDKLLAQAHLSLSNNVKGMQARARDLYDLASIASNLPSAGNIIRRDGPRLLAVSHSWRANADGSRRPDGGFSAVPSFTLGTTHNRLLADAYNEVTERIVWGRRIKFEDAVRLALTLDPGPAAE